MAAHPSESEAAHAAVASYLRAATPLAAQRIVRQSLTESGNDIFRVDLESGACVAVRVSPRPAAFRHTERNLAALRALGIPVPRFLADGPTDGGGAFVILEWLPGQDLIHALAGLSDNAALGIAQSVTDIQRRVGTLPESRGYGWAPIGHHATLLRWSEVFGAPAAPEPLAADAAPAERLRHRLREIRTTLEPYFASVRPLCFLDDLTTKNVIVAEDAVRGIIDVDFVCYGDPLMAVGTTLAQLAADAGDVGVVYGRALLDAWNPLGDARRAVHFYAALWALGFLSAAATAGDEARVANLTPRVENFLERAK